MNPVDTLFFVISTAMGLLMTPARSLPKMRVAIGVSESFVQRTIDAIVAGARTGEVGDGKIFVMPVERIARIRTGEEDTAAVTPVD